MLCCEVVAVGYKYMVQAKHQLLNVKPIGTCTYQWLSNIQITRHFDTLTVVYRSKFDG